MANIKSQLKRVKQDEKKALANQAAKSEFRTAIKKAKLAIETGTVEEAKAAVSHAEGLLDRAAQKGVISGNSARRKKSSLARLLAKKK